MAVSIMLEGPEGVGKSLHAYLLSKLLEETTELPVTYVREPGGTLPGEVIRSSLLFADERNRPKSPTAHMLLFTASRAELMATVFQDFSEKHPDGIFISDRGWPSTVYQIVDGVDAGYSWRVQEPFMKKYPDILTFMDVPAEESMVRVALKNLHKGETNWRDSASVETYRSVRRMYWKLFEVNRERAVLVNGFNDPWDIVWGLRRLIINRLRDKGVINAETHHELNFGFSRRDLLRIQEEGFSSGDRFDLYERTVGIGGVRERLERDNPELVFDDQALKRRLVSEWQEQGFLERTFSSPERR